jgi:hypothetical protein
MKTQIFTNRHCAIREKISAISVEKKSKHKSHK